MSCRRIDWLFGAMLCSLVACGGAPPAASSPADAPTAPAETTEATAGEDGSESPSDQPAGTTEAASESAPEATPEAAAPADPYADMPHPPDSDSGRHQLSADDVKGTVKNYRPHLDKVCWTPRVNNSPTGPNTVRVAIEVDVTKKGEVKSIRVVGGKGFKGLAGCVEEHVKRWHFPVAKQSSSLMFPILFERGESTLIRVD
jgi:Gram-negative bacterial TonB protein C-terminal